MMVKVLATCLGLPNPAWSASRAPAGLQSDAMMMCAPSQPSRITDDLGAWRKIFRQICCTFRAGHGNETLVPSAMPDWSFSWCLTTGSTLHKCIIIKATAGSMLKARFRRRKKLSVRQTSNRRPRRHNHQALTRRTKLEPSGFVFISWKNSRVHEGWKSRQQFHSTVQRHTLRSFQALTLRSVGCDCWAIKLSVEQLPLGNTN